MGLPRRLYRRARPSIATIAQQTLDTRIVTRTRLFDNPPDDYTVYSFGTDERYEFERPRHVGDLPAVIESKVGECTVPAPFVVEIEDTTIIGPSALVAADGRIILESALGGYERLIDASVRALLAGQLPFETRFQRPEDWYEGPLFPLVGPWTTDYYHWLTDYLVQVFALEAYREQTGTDPTVLIPANPPGWLQDSLSLAGVDPDQTREWPGNRVHCSRLVVGALRRHTFSTSDGYIHSPAAMARLGDRIRDVVLDDGYDTDAVTCSSRIYVSRADAQDRRIRNEDALMSMLNDYGFERIVPGEHTFEEQVRQFSDAEIVLGPHGAGLTNAIFATETTLVELFGSYQNACFFTLANGLGHGYVSVMCNSQGNDIVADVSGIESLLQDF
ncbi:hypothetical protein GCM10008995_09660 [Halobellus salinus]|uniref:Glycosyltransferase 61 catalytic domain-containing protein n=1 Tax=Halobellus salinus TaxID=931585 RepID=A0A830E8Y7_9EURY|nr:glycosyltransferase family 61 protein [Halobellus salinus]GGJ01955.1 hypothetical protein GCM10008995_09660 [Halobellus salinus]SMP18054.1 Protein of unknown function [Halobellus salinus]